MSTSTKTVTVTYDDAIVRRFAIATVVWGLSLIHI